MRAEAEHRLARDCAAGSAAGVGFQPGGLQRKTHRAAFAILRHAVHPPALGAGLGEPQSAAVGDCQLDAQRLRLQVERRPAHREPLRRAGAAGGMGGVEVEGLLHQRRRAAARGGGQHAQHALDALGQRMPVEAKARERGWRVEAPLAAHALVFLDQQPGPASGSAATGRRAGGRGVGRAQPALQGELQRAAVVGGGEGKVAAGVLLAVEVHPQRVGEQRMLGLQTERDAAQLDQAGRVGLDVQAQARQHFGHRLALAEGQHLLERGGPFLGKRVRGQGDRRRLLAGQHRLPQQAVAAVGLAAFEEQAQARACGPRGDADA